MRDKKGRFVKGEKPWNKGLKGWLEHTEETKKIISETHRGRKFTEEHKRKIGKANKNRVWKKESKEKIGNASRNRICTKETRRKLSKAGKGRKSTWERNGNKNPNWKGGITLSKDYVVAKARERRSRKLKAEGNHTIKEWQKLKEKYNFMCLCCKRFEPEIKLTEDHIIPLIIGGTDYIDNIQPLCFSCNCRKSRKIADYRK